MSFWGLPTRVWWVGRLLRQVERWFKGAPSLRSPAKPGWWATKPASLKVPEKFTGSQTCPWSPHLSSCFRLCNLGEGLCESSKFPLSPLFGLVFESLEHLSFRECVYWAPFFLGGGYISIWKKLLHNKKSRGSMLRLVCILDIGKTLPGSTDWREDQYFCGVLVYLLRRLVLTSKRWSGCLGHLDCWWYSPAQGTPSHLNFSCCDIPS